MRRAAALALAGLAAGCAGAPALPGTWALGAAPDGPAAGTIAGRAFGWRAGAFTPLTGAAIAVDGAPATTSDAGGGFRLAGVAPGAHRLAASAPGFDAVPVAVVASDGAGLAGVALVAFAPGPRAARADRAVVGVVTDPWGAALPGGTVHCVDPASGGGAGGNRRWAADAHGCFAGVLPDATAEGAATFLAYGRLADGRAAEGQTLLVVPVGDATVLGVAVATHVVAPAPAP